MDGQLNQSAMNYRGLNMGQGGLYGGQMMPQQGLQMPMAGSGQGMQMPQAMMRPEAMQVPQAMAQPQAMQDPTQGMTPEQKMAAYRIMGQGIQNMGRGMQQPMPSGNTAQIMRDQNQFRFAGSPQQQMAQALRRR